VAGLFLIGPAAAGAAKPPVWRDVQPILKAKCASCHVLGGIAAFPLTTYKDAKARAALIYAAVRTGQMPPWMPSKDSPAYIGQEKRILTASEKRAIEAWVKGGARR
jgi:mono/diheme cytochrome c family protein